MMQIKDTVFNINKLVFAEGGYVPEYKGSREYTIPCISLHFDSRSDRETIIECTDDDEVTEILKQINDAIVEGIIVDKVIEKELT
jgi:hypothetical protein